MFHKKLVNIYTITSESKAKGIYLFKRLFSGLIFSDGILFLPKAYSMIQNKV